MPGHVDMRREKTRHCLMYVRQMDDTRQTLRLCLQTRLTREY